MRRRFHLARQPVRSPRFSKADRGRACGRARIFKAAGRFLLKPLPDPPTGNGPPPLFFFPLASYSVKMRMKTQRRATDTYILRNRSRPSPPPTTGCVFPPVVPIISSDLNSFPSVSNRSSEVRSKLPRDLFPEFSNQTRILRGRSRSFYETDGEIIGSYIGRNSKCRNGFLHF